MLEGLTAMEGTLDAARRLHEQWRARRALAPEDLRRLRHLTRQLRYAHSQLGRASGEAAGAGEGTAASARTGLEDAIRIGVALQRTYEAAARGRGGRFRGEQVELDLHELELIRHRYAALVRR